MRYIYDIKSGLLLVRENDISLRKSSVGSANRTLCVVKSHSRALCAVPSWHCAFAHRRGNTASGSRDPYIENRCHRALNVNSSPTISSHSKIISNERLSIREYEWAKYADVYLGSSHPFKARAALHNTNKHFANIIHTQPPRQEAQFRLRPAANCCHQNCN